MQRSANGLHFFCLVLPRWLLEAPQLHNRLSALSKDSCIERLTSYDGRLRLYPLPGFRGVLGDLYYGYGQYPVTQPMTSRVLSFARLETCSPLHQPAHSNLHSMFGRSAASEPLSAISAPRIYARALATTTGLER
jgi:hypothetical protein